MVCDEAGACEAILSNVYDITGFRKDDQFTGGRKTAQFYATQEVEYP